MEKSLERKCDARRKILIGAYFMEQATEEGNLDSLLQKMDKYLKRNSDRKLFNLESFFEENKSEQTKVEKEF